MAKVTQEELWRKEACDLIRSHTALQFLFQEFFEACGIFSPAPHEPDLVARFEGQRDMGLDLKGVLDTFDPLLFAELTLARAQYLSEKPNEAKPVKDFSEEDDEEPYDD